MGQREFKIGFLLKCAEEGLTAKQAYELAGKLAAAIEKRGKSDKNWADVAKSVFVKTPILAATVGAPLVGMGLGYGSTRLWDVGEADLKEVKKQEIINLYRRKTRELLEARRHLHGIPQAADRHAVK